MIGTIAVKWIVVWKLIIILSQATEGEGLSFGKFEIDPPFESETQCEMFAAEMLRRAEEIENESIEYFVCVDYRIQVDLEYILQQEIGTNGNSTNTKSNSSN